ncbi:MAG: hypothetical protein Q7U04_03085 [Bacteriovorax sp.]|nr:hypothetical protein [Bacteriovorax sp.]
MTSRDLEIFQFVFEHRVVCHLQLVGKFFKGSSRSVGHERLSKVTKSGYLIKSSTYYNGKQTIFYSLTDKGLKSFSENFRYRITNPSFKSDSISHDFGIVNVRRRLEKTSMVVEYVSESVLQSCIELIESKKFRAFSILNSDAALVITTEKDEYQVAFEYEVSDKRESRYGKKLTDYYSSPSVTAVFYVCGNTKIEKLIRQTDLEIGQKYEAKVFTCLEETIYRPIDKLPFVNRDNATFYLS